MIVIYNNEKLRYPELPNGTYELDMLPLDTINKEKIKSIMGDLANIYKRPLFINTKFSTSLNYFIIAHYTNLIAYVPFRIQRLLQIEIAKKVLAYIAHHLYMYYETPITLKFNNMYSVKSANYVKLGNIAMLKYYVVRGNISVSLKRLINYSISYIQNMDTLRLMVEELFTTRKTDRNLLCMKQGITFSGLTI